MARVGRFLEGRIGRGQTVVAPASLAPLLDDPAAPQGDDLPDWTVVSVEQAGALPGPLLQRLLAETTAVFAEDGHVVFARRPTFGLPNLRQSPVVRSLEGSAAATGRQPATGPAAPTGHPLTVAELGDEVPRRAGLPPALPPAGLPRALPPVRPPLPRSSAPGRPEPAGAVPPSVMAGPTEALSVRDVTPEPPAPPPIATSVPLPPIPEPTPAAPPVAEPDHAASPEPPAPPSPGIEPAVAAETDTTPSLGGSGWGGLPARIVALLGPVAGWRMAALGEGADGTARELAGLVLPSGAMLFGGEEDLPESCLDGALLLAGATPGAGAAQLARLLRPGGLALLVAENAHSLGRRLAAALGRPATASGTTAAELRGAVHAAGLVPLRLEGHSLDTWRATADTAPRGLGPMDAGAALLEEAGADAGPRHAAWLLFLVRKP